VGLEEGHKNDPRAGGPFLWGKAEGVGAVQPGEEKALGRPYCGLPVPEGACERAGERLFTGARSAGQGVQDKE